MTGILFCDNDTFLEMMDQLQEEYNKHHDNDDVDYEFCVLQPGHYCSECLECILQNNENQEDDVK